MHNPEEKKFYMLCSYKEAGRHVGDNELCEAFDKAVCESAYFEPDGEVDQLEYLEELDESKARVIESMLYGVSPEIKYILT